MTIRQSIIAYIANNGSQTADSIVQASGFKRSTTSKELSLLVKQGVLERSENPLNRTKPIYDTKRVSINSAPTASAVGAANP